IDDPQKDTHRPRERRSPGDRPVPPRPRGGCTMMTPTHPRPHHGRRATAAGEPAGPPPVPALLFGPAPPSGRIFYYAMTMENCARTGAYFASDYPGIYAYGSVDNAALSDAANLSPTPKVATGYDADANGTFAGASPATDSRGYQTGFVKVTV